MTIKSKFAVILSGCGVFDGSEIHETVATLLAIDQQNAVYQCFAPDVPQKTAVNHLTSKTEKETRNVLAEAARIARGQILSLDNYSSNDFDAIIFPGGMGAILNLCNFAEAGTNCRINPNIEKIILEAWQLKKPIGALCIAPVVIAKVLGSKNAIVTIGSDEKTAERIRKMGANHQICSAEDICIDEENKIVTCPCYMLAESIKEVATGASAVIAAMIKMIKNP